MWYNLYIRNQYRIGVEKMNIAEFAAGIKKPVPVVSGEEYCIAASGLDHGHIGGMVSGLHDAGARLLYVYDSVRSRAEAMAQRYGAKVVDSMEEIYADRRVKMVCSAAIPARRGPLGCEVMRHGMDFFADKAPFTTIEQLEEAKRTEKETGQRYFVYYSERLHNESAIMAGYLIREGVIGKVVNIIGTGPHRISLPTREPWFFTRKDYGGILTDIGSHQAEQFLFACEHHLAEHVVDQNADHDDRHIIRVVVAVKEERSQHQKQLIELDALRQPAEHEIDKKRQRQEGEHEYIGIKQHTGFSLRRRVGWAQSKYAGPAARRAVISASSTSLFACA